MADDRRGSRREPGGGRAPEEEARLFLQEMEDVQPVAGRQRVITPLGGRRRGDAAGRAVPPPARARARFEVERYGERVEGLARGGDRRQLRALGRGEIPVDETLDLHRLTEKAARRAVEALLQRAVAEDLRCLLLIHGRGLRSPAGPVLKEALPRWLTRSAHAPRILAFVTAPPHLGAGGATLVLLRRRRGRRSR